MSTVPLKGSHLGAETTGRKTPQRARLSDITNTTTASFSKHRDENQLSIKVSDTQLHKAKLAKALERADDSQKAGPSTSEKISCDKQAIYPNVLTKLAESRARRTVSTYEAPSEHLDHVQDEGLEHPATCRSTLRRRVSLSYKEPSLKAKLRQTESATPSQVKPCISRRESEIHQLHKVCEEDASNASIAMPCNSESEVIESFVPPLSKSASQATSDSSCALSLDMFNDQISSTSCKSKERIYAASATHFKFGDDFSMKTTDSPSISEGFASGRPSRRSVSCISSYKEAPLNTKMRRPS